MYDARRQKVSLNSWLDKKRKKEKKTPDSCVVRRADFEIPLEYVQHFTSKVIRFYKLGSK
jgi:hypothetical protein